MADNVVVKAGDAGSDITVSTDDAGVAGHVQRVKLTYSADGSATHAQVDADGVLVNLGANNDVVVSDGGNVISVDDASGSLTVDAPVGTPVQVQVGDGSNQATVRNLAANDALNVAIVDGSGNQVTSFAGSGGTSMTDDAAFTPGTTPITPAAGIYRSVRDSVTDNDAGALAMTATRALYATLETPAGDSAMDEANDAVQVSIVADDLAATEYAEGTTDATISGPAIMWEDTSDTLRAVSVAKPLPVTHIPSATGGCSVHRSLDLDETEEEAKATAGTVYGWYVTNRATTPRYLKFYNATAATVVVGTTTPLMTFEIPANASDHVGANALGGIGIAFTTAITVAATTGLADNDTGAPSANDVVVNIFYI